MDLRETILKSIEANPRVPVLILGGGVNGCGLFRELALQGVDCLLVDKADYVSGASSKSSRMIHGGLRYLENREFRLVRESLLERNRLLENAAHYVTPLKTTIPLFSWLGGLIRSTLVFLGFPVRPGGRGVAIVKLGLAFYDFVTRRNRRTPRHYLTSKAKSLAAIPGLNPNIVATATYWDAQISQAERLCIEMLQDACAANPNCHALNYVRLLDVPRLARPAVSSPARSDKPTVAQEEGTVGQADRGTAGGILTFRDEVTGQEFSVEPQIIVNATGAWVDHTNAILGLKTRFIGGTKGSHLVVDNPRLYHALGGQMVYYEHQDGRICIVFPFGDKVLMGSTDIRIDDPETVRCDEAEIDYMLTTLRGIFPAVEIRREEIVYVFCGVRPLPASGEGVVGKISRGHSIRVIEPDSASPFPIFNLIGGKWTTFRAFAEQAADQILHRLGLSRRGSTQHTPIGGGRDFPESPEQRKTWIDRLAARSGLRPERIATLLDRYGTAAEAYASPPPLVHTLPRGDDSTGRSGVHLSPSSLVPTLPRGDDSTGRSGVHLSLSETPLQSLPDYTVGEIARIAATEQVVHLADLVCRRTTLALLGLATPTVLGELTEILGGFLSWDRARSDEELRQALRETAPSAHP